MLYEVTMPIAGHVRFEVEAESQEEAIEKAHEMESEDGDVSWDFLEQFHQGSVCYCPRPWKVTAEELE